MFVTLDGHVVSRMKYNIHVSHRAANNTFGVSSNMQLSGYLSVNGNYVSTSASTGALVVTGGKINDLSVSKKMREGLKEIDHLFYFYSIFRLPLFTKSHLLNLEPF